MVGVQFNEYGVWEKYLVNQDQQKGIEYWNIVFKCSIEYLGKLVWVVQY